ncbi:MAG: hypothetical protein GF388_05030 [Candidatus Aegiribacteria sp.]|nr:hypothetical protein [Candidatus Aegiribacteria sp.]MBD3294582.1 hypothetical protein [Candidatus Fermentibacteria bacterium]
MEKKFVPPVLTFLTGAGLWIIVVVLKLVKSGITEDNPQLSFFMCIAAAMLMVISGFLCMLSGGPAFGQLVRLGVLLGLAAYTYWVIDETTGIWVLVIAGGAAILSVIAFFK